MLELAASTTAHFPAVDHPGGLWYAQERKRLDEAARRGGGGGDIAEQKKDQPAPESAVTLEEGKGGAEMKPLEGQRQRIEKH